MFGRILLPVDGSESSRRAAAFGLELAATYDADVDVVCVLGSGSTHGSGAEPGPDPRERGEQMLTEVASDADDVDVETHVIEGPPAKTIVDRADAWDADLVAMGRHGHTGLGERLLGSVLERVLRHVDAPVLAVPDGSMPDPDGIGDVLVPTDGSETADLAGPYGADIAREHDAVLHLVGVLDVKKEAGIFDAGGATDEYVERLREEARDDVDSLRAAVDATDDTDVTRAVVRGRAHEGIREYAEKRDVDLVAMGSHDETHLTGQAFSSVTDRVLRVVSVPVLVVPET